MKITVTGKRQITIPVKICEELNINTGDKLECQIIKNHTITLKKIKENKKNICPHCNSQVSPITNHVLFENRMYHLECWVKNNK